MLPINPKPKGPLVIDKMLPINPKPKGPLVVDKMLPINPKPKGPLVVDKMLPLKPKGPLVIDKVLPVDPDLIKPINPPKGGGKGGGGKPPKKPKPGFYWDFHFCMPHFHAHCWNPTHHCYNIWIFRGGTWVYETIYNLEILSQETPLTSIALTEPVPYEYVEKMEDGTIIERLGTYWTNPNGLTQGREQWVMTHLGPDVIDRLTESGDLLKTSTGFVGSNTPTEYENVEERRDGTIVERQGTWFVDSNGLPQAEDLWTISTLGPVTATLIENAAAPYFE
jgi:hypothetical protein